MSCRSRSVGMMRIGAKDNRVIPDAIVWFVSATIERPTDRMSRPQHAKLSNKKARQAKFMPAA